MIDLLEEIKNMTIHVQADKQEVKDLIEDRFAMLMENNKNAKANLQYLEIRLNTIVKELIRNLIIYGPEEEEEEKSDILG